MIIEVLDKDGTTKSREEIPDAEALQAAINALQLIGTESLKTVSDTKVKDLIGAYISLKRAGRSYIAITQFLN